MRCLILLILFTCFHFTIKAQCDTSLIGTWKPISVSTEEVYYNFLTDSVSVSEEMKINNPDSSARTNMISMIKFVFADFRYTFGNDSSYEMSLLEEVKLQGKYCFCNEKNTLKIISENEMGALVTDTLKASLNNGILFLRISLQDEDFFEFTLKRENSESIIHVNTDINPAFNTSHTIQTAHARSLTSPFLYTSKVQQQPVRVFSPSTISNSRSF